MSSRLVYGTLGYALPAASGAKLAKPEPIISLIGDGGLQFTTNELSTAVEAQLQVAVIAWYNQRYEMIAQIIQLSQSLIEESSGVLALHDKAYEQFVNGEDVYLLSVGDTDLATLPSTIRATIDSLDKGHTNYALGMGEKHLRQIISDIEIKSSDKHYDPSNVVIFPRATNAIYTVMACLLNAGEDVIVAELMYVGYDGIFKALNVNVVTVELDVERVKAAVIDKTRVVFINTPGNPAGIIISEQHLKDLANLCLENNL